jgi:hypothetical protein
LAWCLARRGWNVRTCRKIRWSNESRFLLHVTDGRMRVWRHKNIAYTPRNIQPTVPYGGSVMASGCISHDCKSRRVIKSPLLEDRHRGSRLAWCLARRGWNLRTWHKIHGSDENRFLLHVTDGRMRVWRHKNTAYTRRNIQPTVPYGGCSVMVWWCISHDCRLDLVTIQGNLTGDQYIISLSKRHV